MTAVVIFRIVSRVGRRQRHRYRRSVLEHFQQSVPELSLNRRDLRQRSGVDGRDLRPRDPAIADDADVVSFHGKSGTDGIAFSESSQRKSVCGTRRFHGAVLPGAKPEQEPWPEEHKEQGDFRQD